MMPREDVLLILNNLISDQSSPPAEALLSALVDQADALLCGYLGVHTLPEVPRMNHIRAMTAVVLYNRRGAEGEIKRTEGEVSTWFETFPEFIKHQLRPFRQAQAVRLSDATL